MFTIHFWFLLPYLLVLPCIPLIFCMHFCHLLCFTSSIFLIRIPIFYDLGNGVYSFLFPFSAYLISHYLYNNCQNYYFSLSDSLEGRPTFEEDLIKIDTYARQGYVVVHTVVRLSLNLSCDLWLSGYPCHVVYWLFEGKFSLVKISVSFFA